MQYITNRSTLGGFSVLKERGDIVAEEEIMKYVIENMNDRFDKLDKKLDSMRVENSENNKDIAKNCSVKRAEIYSTIENNKDEADGKVEANRKVIEKLDKKVFQLFFIGTGVGFLLGVATTVVAKSLIGG